MKESLESYFLDLSKKIYLSPSKSVLKTCVSYLNEIDADLQSLKILNVEGCPIYYSHSDIILSSDDLQSSKEMKVENAELLESLTSSYVFANIKEE